MATSDVVSFVNGHYRPLRLVYLVAVKTSFACTLLNPDSLKRNIHNDDDDHLVLMTNHGIVFIKITSIPRSWLMKSNYLFDGLSFTYLSVNVHFNIVLQNLTK